MHMESSDDEIKLFSLQAIKNLDKSMSYANIENNQDFNILTDRFSLINRLPTLNNSRGDEN
jgi:hypothetical protein